jgi:hypothetical protein
MDWPVFVLAATPGLVIHIAGVVTILRPRGSDPAVSLRGGRMMLFGFGLFVLGPALVLVIEGAIRGDPLLIAAPFVAFGPAVVLRFWFARRVRLNGS